jgi:hypothetical protein
MQQCKAAAVQEGAMHRIRWVIGAGLAIVLVAARGDDAPVAADRQADHRLGTVHFPISCAAEAQAQFDRATALLHHMTYPQAREAFEQVAATDPGCAMAHWGVAMTLFQRGKRCRALGGPGP